MALSSRAIIGEFFRRLFQNPGMKWIEALSMYFTSDQPSEEYRWVGMSPTMREWIGGRLAKGLREFGIVIENKKFEATLEFEVDDLNRDKTGQLLVRIQELADRTNTHWAKLLSELINYGDSRVCYDGMYFFDKNHKEGESGTQSNLLNIILSDIPVDQKGTIESPSPEVMEKVIFKGIEQILSFKDDQGEPLNEGAQKFLVMLPTHYMNCGYSAITNPTLRSGQTNSIVNMNDFDIIPVVNPRLKWQDAFSIFRADGNIKPFIRQEERAVQLKIKGEGSDLDFDEEKHQYGVSTSRNAGYGTWQHACKVVLEA